MARNGTTEIVCTLQTCPLSFSEFDYRPSLPANAIFAVIFGVCILAQLVIGIKYKTWGYMVAMIMGCIAELVGYIGRIMLYQNPFNEDAFLQYLVTLTIAPALLTAAIYLCLGRIVNVYGTHLSYFRPGTYTVIFCTLDFICLLLQAIGGAIASTGDTQSTTDLGRNIMIAGLIFQIFALSIFVIVSTWFAINVYKGRKTWNATYTHVTSSKLFKGFLLGLGIAVITIQLRSIYRTDELWEGFNSALFRGHEPVFIVLESIMIVVACSCLTILHPAICLRGSWHDANFQFRKEKKSTEESDSATGPEEMSNSGERV